MFNFVAILIRVYLIFNFVAILYDKHFVLILLMTFAADRTIRGSDTPGTDPGGDGGALIIL